MGQWVGQNPREARIPPKPPGITEQSPGPGHLLADESRALKKKPRIVESNRWQLAQSPRQVAHQRPNLFSLTTRHIVFGNGGGGVPLLQWELAALLQWGDGTAVAMGRSETS